MNYTFLLYVDDKTTRVYATIQKRVDFGSAPDFVCYKNELYELREEEAANLKYVKKDGIACVALS